MPLDDELAELRAIRSAAVDYCVSGGVELRNDLRQALGLPVPEQGRESPQPDEMISVSQKAYRELCWNLDGVSGALIDAGDVTVHDDDYAKSIQELTAQRDTARAEVERLTKANALLRAGIGALHDKADALATHAIHVVRGAR